MGLWNRRSQIRHLWKGIGIGAGVGAALMFLFDPDRGRRRRALARDKAIRAANSTERVLGARSRDWSNRARGAAAQMRALLKRESVPDEVLEQRVRAEIGRLVSNPGPIQVRAREGTVTLSGPILSSERDALLSGVSSVSGVKSVENHLEVHPSAAASSSQEAREPRSS